MYTIKLEKTTIQVIDNADQLPAERWFRFLYLFTLCIGITVDNLPLYFSSLAQQISRGNKEDALSQVRNMQIAFHNALNNVDLASPCLSILFYSIDDQVITDYSDIAITKRIKELKEKGLRLEHLTPVINAVKKKLMPNFVSESS
jgi:hypothetical protein